MTTHELAKILLTNQDMPLALGVNHHTYSTLSDRASHGGVNVAFYENYEGSHIMVSNFYDREFGGSNEQFGTLLHVETAKEKEV